MHRRIRPYAVLPSLAPFQEAVPSGHQWSIDFDGTTEHLRTYQTTTKLGYNNAFTAMCWAKANPVAVNDYLFEIEGLTNNRNGISIYSYGTASGMRVALYGFDGTTAKLYDKAAAFNMDAWSLYGVTWDGAVSAMKVYKDGTELTMTKTTDQAVVQIDTVYKISIPVDQATSAKMRGVVHQLAIWNEPLTSGEMLACYNSGAPFDYRGDQGDYASSANLVRLFWLGNLGPVEGSSSTWGIDLIDGDIDLFQGAANVTSGDVVTDIPS